MKKVYLVMAAMLAGILLVQAQRTVTGKITDANDGAPLPGVTISLKDGKTLGVSDAQGNFSVEVPGATRTMILSMIGYTDHEITVGNAPLLVKMTTGKTVSLTEVIVTGYSTQSRRQATASVSRISGQDVKLQPVASFDQLLQGKAPGVLIQSQSGQPGSAASNITIRGKGSVLASTQPLFIVDGIQITGADFQSISPADIDNYSILKDAVATSQYGSRGANGVIVVTTKRGANTKTRINYDFQYGSGQLPENKLKLMSSSEKINFERNYDHLYGSNFFGWTDAEADSLAKVDARWDKVMFRKAKTQQHILSMTGGNDKTRFFLSGSVFDQEGLVVATGLKRYTGRLNIDHTVNNLKLGFSTFAGFSKFSNTTGENGQWIGAPLNAIRWHNPYVTAYLPDGSYNNADLFLQGQPNALQELLENPFTNRQLKAITSLSLEYKFPFLRGLSARTNWGVDYTDDDNTQYIDKTTFRGSQQIRGQGSFARGSTKRSRFTGTTSLTYTRQLEDHSFRVVVFNEYIKRRTSTFGYTGFGLTGVFGNGADVTPGTPSNGYIPLVADGQTEQSLLSWFSIADYSFKNKYFVNASARRDGSSRLAEGNKWVNYGGIGLGWLLTAEKFLDHSKWLSELKLKISYGSAGNEDVGDSYEAREQFTGSTYNGIGGLILSNLEKPNLTWEVRRTLNAGFDYGFFDNRITGSIEVYNAITAGLYLNRQLSGTNGVNAILTNLGRIRNRGIEFAIQAGIIRKKNFTWELSFNHTYNQSKVLELDGTEQNINGTVITKVGARLNSVYLVRYAGVDPANGDALYYLADGKTTTNVFDPNDKVITGSYDPPHFGGFTNTISFRGIELGVQFNYMYGHVIYNNDRANVENPVYVVSSVSRDLLTQWQKPGDVTNIPSPFSNFELNSTRFLEKGDFLRLRNVSLSYELPKTVLAKAKINSLRIFIQGQNLYTWHQFKGWDPEVATGVLGGAQYPQTKTITAGLNLGL